MVEEQGMKITYSRDRVGWTGQFRGFVLRTQAGISGVAGRCAARVHG